MDQIKQQSLIVMIESIEAQLAAVKTIIYMSEGPITVLPKDKQENHLFTTQSEDDLIEKALAFEESERDKLMLGLIDEAKESIKDDTKRQ